MTVADLPGLRSTADEWSHVFSSHPFDPVLDRAQGIYLYDEDDKRYIDASGGPMCCNLPHGDRRVIDAVCAQMERFAYCHPTLSNRPKADLCRAIARHTPGDLNHVYPVSGGSEAVETAIKLARQYHVISGRGTKYQVIAHHDSYHGMSLAALGVSGNPGSQRMFEPMLPKWPRIQQYSDMRRPAGATRDEWAEHCAVALEEAIHYAGHGNVAAFLATPVGCGSDYATVAPAHYWRRVREICDQYDVLLIADEVVTGFGRTGAWFAMEHFGVVPDLMTMAKGISGATMPLGAVVASDRINQPFAEGAAFVHGFTFGGHPVACAAGLATIRVLEEDGLVENAAKVGNYLAERTEELQANHRTLVDFRGKGLLHVGELVKDPDTMEFFDRKEQAETRFQAIALKNGLVFYGTLYGSRRTPSLRRGLPLFVAPPLSITVEQADDLVGRLDQTLSEWEGSLGVST